jgi:glycosyltransferase involved in cell wall biosynthesis
MTATATTPAINVGFWFDAPFEYSGGLNYFHNLLYALAQVNDGSVHAYVFFANDIPDAIERRFTPYATVVRTKLLQRYTVSWLAHKLAERVFGVMPLFTALLRTHDIHVLSHVWFVCKGRMPFRIIAWIPDFQYLHLPDLFPTLDTSQETRTQQRIIAQSDVVVVSSNDAFQDFKRVAMPAHQSLGKVMHFVSQPVARVASSAPTLESIERKYHFNGRYFHLPNQIWAHKNHLVVLQAVDRLKRSGVEVQVLCTGNTKDYRVTGAEYINQLREFIEANDLHHNIRILGLIDYGDVLFLMRNAVAVINPSRFEGWSSSVEEAKSMGTPVVLSNIGVHVEQDPANGHYFDPNDFVGLAEILKAVWYETDTKSRFVLEIAASEALRERTLAFGREYFHLLASVAGREAQQMEDES